MRTTVLEFEGKTEGQTGYRTYQSPGGGDGVEVSKRPLGRGESTGVQGKRVRMQAGIQTR